MKKILIIALIVIFVSGCTTMGNQAITEQGNFVSLKVGESGKSTIFGKFGQPHDVLEHSPNTGWRYIRAKTSPEPAMFIIGIIIWPLLFFGQTDYEISQTDFLFDASGKLVDVSTRKGDLRKGLASAGDSFSDQHKATMSRVKTEMELTNLPYDEKAAKGSLEYLAI